MPDKRPTAKFRFVMAEDFRVLPVNSVWGARTNRGDVMVNLVNERHALPTEVVNELTPEGGIGNEVSRDVGNNDYVRTVLAGMVLTPEQAYSIGEWLKAVSGLTPPAPTKTDQS